jgi:ribonuclease-3
VGGTVYGTGEGRSKKEAEAQAAEAAWSVLRTRVVPPARTADA